MLRLIFVSILLFYNCYCVIPNANVAHPLNNAYNNFWDGAVGGSGYWGNLPKQKQNVFSSSFDKKGFDSIYNLNSLSPFTSSRADNFDSFVPYYTPYGASKYNFVPTKSNHLSNEELGSFSYDVNEPRYQKLYKDYYNFFNLKLDRFSGLQKYHMKDTTSDEQKRIENPGSYDYGKYFDTYDEEDSLYGPDLPKIKHRNISLSSAGQNDERRLKQTQKLQLKKKLVDKIVEDLDFLEDKNKEKKGLKLKNKIHNFERQLRDVQKDKMKQQSIYSKLYNQEKLFNKNYPNALDVNVNAYEHDSKPVL